MKMCLLKGHNPLGINNGSYSFGNYFSTSSLSFFLETQKTCESSLKFLFVKHNQLCCVFLQIRSGHQYLHPR